MFKNILFLCVLVSRYSSKYVRFFLDIVVGAFRSERCCTTYLIRSISIITDRSWFIVLSWLCLIGRDRNLDWGYSRSLPTPTFRHSRTRHKSRSWVIARRVGRYVCAHKRSRCTAIAPSTPMLLFHGSRRRTHYTRFNIGSRQRLVPNLVPPRIPRPSVSTYVDSSVRVAML